MSVQILYAAVRRFSVATHALSETTLDNMAWACDAYAGVRYAFLHTTLELRQLATHLQVERMRAGVAPTLAQHALAQHQVVFRDFEALLLGVIAETYGQEPKPGEWAMNTIIAHVHEVERWFLAAILNCIQGGEPRRLNDAEIGALLDEPPGIPSDLPLDAMWAAFTCVHGKVQTRLQALTAEQLPMPSAAWEPEPWPTVEFRLHRFEAHLSEHTNQLEKTLRWLGQEPGEAKQLLRQLYRALAEVEGLAIGAEALTAGACAEMAATIDRRLVSLTPALDRIQAMNGAVAVGEVERVRTLLGDDPNLAYTTMDDGEPALLYSLYRGRQPVVDALLASGMRLHLHEAVAVGDTPRVVKIVDAWPDAIEYFARDGYTPLQLACFFGHAEIAALLVARGAHVHAVARNSMKIQPIHAAVAGQHVAIVELLIAHGADVNARQQDDFTPLMAARQSGNAVIEQLLLAAGAVP